MRRVVSLLPSATARVSLSDSNAYFNRPVPRLVESLEIIAACVHPEHFRDFTATHRDGIVPIERVGE